MAATKMVFQIWKISGLEDFQTISRKSSDGAFSDVLIRWFSSSTWIYFSDLKDFWARRLLDDFQEVLWRSLLPCLPFIIDLSVLVLIRWFSSSTWICFTDLSLIYMFFRSGSDFGRLMGSLLGSLLKYNVLEVQTTSKKSSMKSSDGFFFHIKWSLSLSLWSKRNDL
ncbi:hypothetical protein DY000_02056409 [Brassica cretica]|uniref:Uncharacterized protein n=1 Tax=Brassica cretica TaxID=69181 RepID=A0ABQ7A4K0_BRACR|nr:hypothetical protein DY000_02056409 [Brassica cretica]